MEDKIAWRKKNTPRSKAKTNRIDAAIVLFLPLLLNMSGALAFSNLASDMKGM
jgi:hypothetical protein